MRQGGSVQGRGQLPQTNRFHGLPVAGFAVAGLVLAHALSYAIAVPDPYHRDLLLHRTGHDYLPAFGQVALMLFVAGVAAVVFRASGRHAGATTSHRFAPLATRLALVQVGAFMVQEVTERLLAGSGLHDLGHGHVFIVGVAAQIAVAFAGAALLRWLARASDRLAEIARLHVLHPASRSGVRAAGLLGPCVRTRRGPVARPAGSPLRLTSPPTRFALPARLR